MHSVWCMVYGIWCMVLCVVYGVCACGLNAWVYVNVYSGCMVYGVWCMVYGGA